MRKQPRRTSRFSQVFALLALTTITGLAITATTAGAAGVRFGFVDSVTSWFGGGATVNGSPEPQLVVFNSTAQALPFSQDWSDTSLIASDDIHLRDGSRYRKIVLDVGRFAEILDREKQLRKGHQNMNEEIQEPIAYVIRETETQYVVHCPYCYGEHFHGNVKLGSRGSHCVDGKGGGYELRKREQPDV